MFPTHSLTWWVRFSWAPVKTLYCLIGCGPFGRGFAFASAECQDYHYFKISLNSSFSRKFTDHPRRIRTPNLCENRLMAMNFKGNGSFLLSSPTVILCLSWWLAFSPVHHFHWGSKASCFIPSSFSNKFRVASRHG